jgi:hypothetical protein
LSDAIAFNPTANPDAYVPWSGSERALHGLTDWLAVSERPVCLLAGPPGLGKTLLLRLLGSRARDRFVAVHQSYPDCEPGVLCDLLLQALVGVAAGDPETLLHAVLADPGRDRDALLLIDEGELLPTETAQWLRELVHAEAGLRVAIAVTRESACEALARIFDDACEVVRLDGAMSREEVAALVQRALARGDVEPCLRVRFDAAAIDDLHQRSQGVPAALQSLASARLFETRRAHGAAALEGGWTPQPRGAATARADSAIGPRPARVRRRVVETRTGLGRRLAFALAIVVGFLAGVAATLALQRAREPLALDAPPPAPPVSTPPADDERAEAERVVLAPAAAAIRDVAAAPPAVPANEPAAAALETRVSVSLNADPWARIAVDGVGVGETPIAALPLAPGPHRFTAQLPDGRVVERDVVIDADNRRVVFP